MLGINEITLDGQRGTIRNGQTNLGRVICKCVCVGGGLMPICARACSFVCGRERTHTRPDGGVTMRGALLRSPLLGRVPFRSAYIDYVVNKTSVTMSYPGAPVVCGTNTGGIRASVLAGNVTRGEMSRCARAVALYTIRRTLHTVHRNTRT